MKPLTPPTAFRHVYHAVYLQFFFGGMMIAITEVRGPEPILLGVDAVRTGAMLIFLGINIYCYLRRYEKALAAPRF